MTTYRVLVVDDKEPHAEGLAELLSLAGFESSYALTGREGIEYARGQNVDAVLLDLNLPDMSGYDVCRILRESPETAGVAVVFHTAEPMSHDRHDGDAFLTYPIGTDHLVQVLHGCIIRRKGIAAPTS